MRNVKKEFPESRLYAVGFSLGANLLLNYLGEEREAAPFEAAVSLCNPFNLVRHHLRTGSVRLLTGVKAQCSVCMPFDFPCFMHFEGMLWQKNARAVVALDGLDISHMTPRSRICLLPGSMAPWFPRTSEVA